MATDPDVIVKRQDGIFSVTLNRPAQANALSAAAVESIIEAIQSVAGEPTAQIRCGVISGNGRHFCAGFDLSDLDTLSDGDLLWRFLRIETMLQAVHHAPFPILALAHGQVIGAGADLFAACSARIAAPGSRFRMPGWHFELALGTRRLTRLIGSKHARNMLLDAATVAHEQALAMGLVDTVAPREHWEQAIAKYAERAQTLSPFAVSSMMALTTDDTREQDIAAIVATAGRPGLKERVLAFREAVASQRSAREQQS